jgi:ATP-dependent helicase/nuclease subunit A
MFGHPLAANWFDGSMRIVNETALLEPTFALHRPDRVMLGTTETLVIEYKSGDRNPSHQRQLSRYMRLMEQVQEMPVRGFVWYINENELIEVE